MNLGQMLAHLWADPLTNDTLILIVAVPVLDLLTGVSRAIADGTFTFGLLDVWVRTKIAGRVVPIALVLLFGTVIGDVSVGDFHFNVLTTAAMAAAITFLAAEAASIVANLQPTTPHGAPSE